MDVTITMTYDYIPGGVQPVGFLRKAPKHKKAARFDKRTFIYDICYSADNSLLYVISPPANNGCQPWYNGFRLQVSDADNPVADRTLEPVSVVKHTQFCIYGFQAGGDAKTTHARVVTDKTVTPWQRLERNNRPPATLVATTMIKNENHNLREWIEYHLLQGVDRFVIYDNCSANQQQLFETLAPYRDIVTLVNWPFPYGFSSKRHHALYSQKGQITHCVLKYGGSAVDWMIVSDVDEFIHSPRMPLLDYLRSQPDDVTGIRGNRLNYGKADKDANSALAIGRFTHCESFVRKSKRLEKYVIRPGRVTACSQHFPERYTGRLRQPEQEEFRFHHYQYTSAKKRKQNPRNQRITSLHAYVPEIERRISPVLSFAELADLIRSRMGERKRVLFFQVPGNGGDAIISAAAQQFLRDFAIPFEFLKGYDTQCQDELIIINAAGNLASNYKSVEKMLRAKHTTNDVILLPCSVDGHEHVLSGLSKRVTIVARERFSHAHVFRHFTWVNQLHLAHDMACYLRGRVPEVFGIPSASPTRKLLHAFRRDSEKPASGGRKAPKGYKNIDVSMGLHVGPTSAASAVGTARKMLLKLGEHRLVKTDRLHGAIGAWLMGRKVEFYAGSYYKNRGVYNLSLRDSGSSVRWRG